MSDYIGLILLTLSIPLAIPRIRRWHFLVRALHLLRAALLWLTAGLCYLLGLAVGIGVRWVLWCAAAAVAGYVAGRRA